MHDASSVQHESWINPPYAPLYYTPLSNPPRRNLCHSCLVSKKLLGNLRRFCVKKDKNLSNKRKQNFERNLAHFSVHLRKMSGNLGETRNLGESRAISGNLGGISGKSRGNLGGILGNLGESRGISGNLGETRGNSGNLGGISGKSRGNLGEARGISGNLGESRGISGNLGESRGVSGKLGESRGNSGNLGETRDKLAGISGKLGGNSRETWGNSGGLSENFAGAQKALSRASFSSGRFRRRMGPLSKLNFPKVLESCILMFFPLERVVTEMAVFCKGKGLCQEVSGRSASSKNKNHRTMKKIKTKTQMKKMKIANLQKHWLEPLDLFGKTDLRAETRKK